MNNWQADFLTDIGQTDSFQDILDVTQRTTNALGFEYCSWVTHLPLPLTRPEHFAVTTTEDNVHNKVRAGTYGEAPVFQHCETSTTPFSWLGHSDDPAFALAPHIFEDYFSWGHRGGWAQSVVDGVGTYSIFLAGSANVFEKKDIEHIDLHMQWITTAVHNNMFRARNGTDIKLTLREREILRWTGDGKTAEDIATILHLNQNTVNFHLQNVMRKLDCPNKTAAVVKAIFLNLIFEH